MQPKPRRQPKDDKLPLAWCPHHQRGFAWLLVGTPTTASPGIAAGLVSTPPAGIRAVVGEDTNNGTARHPPAGGRPATHEG